MNQTQKGMAYYVASFFVAALVDAPVKYLLVHGLPQPTVMFFRFLIALIFLIGWQVSKGKWFSPSKHPKLNIIRGCILFSSGFVNFYALKHLPLATAASINFAAPLITCALAQVFLGEHVGIRRWLAVIIGFGGVLIVMRPGTSAYHPAMLASLATAFTIAIFQIVTRKVGFKDEPETGLLWVFGICLIITTVWLPTGWQMPSLGLWPFMVLVGVAGLGTHVLMSRSLQLAKASTVAPLIYTQIVWMIIFGIILFGNWPDVATLLGSSVVIASGIYVWHRERVIAQPAEI
jgi:drug/metabolite transporter (DMT)-like permease